MSDTGDNSGDVFDMSDGAVNAATKEQLMRFIERIETLIEERKTISDDIKDVKTEAKSQGFDTTIMMRVIALRKLDSNQREELDALIDTYRAAVGI